MPSSAPQIPKVLNVLIVLGILAPFLIMIWFVSLLKMMQYGNRANNMPPLVGELGAEGSTCGGPQRFPCNPGLVCDATNGEAQTGICVKDTRTISPLGEAGQSCGADVGCLPGLLCVSTEDGSFCMPVATGTVPMAE